MKTAALFVEIAGIACLLWAAALIHPVLVLVTGGLTLVGAGAALERIEDE